MPKRKGQEKPVQARYVKVLPPIQKKDVKRYSLDWDALTAGKDSTSQTPPTVTALKTAIGRKTSEPAMAKFSQTASSPRFGREKKLRVSESLDESVIRKSGGPDTQSFLSINSTSPSSKAPNQRQRSVSDNMYLPYPVPTAPPLSDARQPELDTKPHPVPTSPPLSDARQPELDTKQFVRTGDVMSLWNITNSEDLQLPQLFVAESKYDGPPVIEKGQVIMVVKIKTVTQIQGTYSNGKELTLSSASSLQLSPLGEGVKVSQSLTAKALLSLKSLPPVVTVAKQFTVASETVVTSGTRLFLQRNQPPASKYKATEHPLLARDLGGREFALTANCSGIFSTHPRDTSLVLQEVIKHCQFPLKVLAYDSKEEMTLESVSQQQMLVSYPFNTRQKSEATVFELPAEGSLQLVRVIMQSEEMESNMHPDDEAVENNLENTYEVIPEHTASESPQQMSPTQQATSPDALRDDPYSVVRSLSQDRSSTPASPFGSLPYPSGASAIGTTDEYNEKKIAENLVYLKSMHVDEIIQLLESMQLDEYKESFKKEKIDGEVLSSLTEADLLHELNIQKRLHRVRLMKVIEGVYSASEILTQIYI